MWNRVWELIQTTLPQQQLSTEASSSEVQEQASQLFGRPLNSEELALVQQELNALQGEEELSSNGAIAQNIKQEVESILTDTLHSIRDYVPYIIGLSFFLSVQFVTPFLGYITFFFTEIVIRFLLWFKVISIHQKEVTVSTYVLE